MLLTNINFSLSNHQILMVAISVLTIITAIIGISAVWNNKNYSKNGKKVLFSLFMILLTAIIVTYTVDGFQDFLPALDIPWIE